MMATAAPLPSAPRSPWRSVLTFFYNHPNLTLSMLLLLPMLWMVVFYLGSIGGLLVHSFYFVDDFTVVLSRQFSLRTWGDLFTLSHLDVFFRTFTMALSVTIACAIISFPLAYYMARYANRRIRGLLYLGVMVPLWSSYLVRVYAWKLILADEGIISWTFRALGLQGVLDVILSLPVIGGQSLSFSLLGMFLVFVYIWLPYMILPINAALERVPKSLIEASSDLGGKPGYTFRKVILPLAIPGVIAGSIFTFSLTLGDYIIPQIIGNSAPFIGLAIYRYQGSAGNLPLAAAFTVIPIVVMMIYLLLAKRTGAFEAL
jgi:putative spermidine/putrescine transport system permease protein